MADEYPIPKDDPRLNDDSQPSVTNTYQALKLADENAGVPEGAAVIPAPADAIDMEYRKAIADQSAEAIGKAVAEASKEEPNEEASDDAGTGPFEGRSVAQLKVAAAAKGLPTSGTKDELVERLRG